MFTSKNKNVCLKRLDFLLQRCRADWRWLQRLPYMIMAARTRFAEAAKVKVLITASHAGRNNQIL